MATTRRRFLSMSAAATGVLSVGASTRAAARDPLRVLILGGTGFIGPHMVERALARGHQVTLFNRGRSNTELFPDVEKLVGDRDGQLGALETGQWDAVIDNSGYVPRLVGDSANLLKGRAAHYLFISSISAYADFATVGIDEDYRLGRMSDQTVENVTAETYGPLKVLCEKAVTATFQNRATVVRPGYIVGPRDSTDRWTYWPVRLAAGGEMMVPGSPQDHVQFIDARDLASFVIGLLETSTHGVFNAVGPNQPITMGQMLNTMQPAIGSDARLTWVDSDFLLQNNALFPIWSPATGDTLGVHRIDNDRAMAAGLTTRPATATTLDTLAWWASLDEARRAEMRSGLRVPPSLPFGPASMSRQRDEERRLLALLTQGRA